jgi:general secretion pathway protein I
MMIQSNEFRGNASAHRRAPGDHTTLRRPGTEWHVSTSSFLLCSQLMPRSRRREGLTLLEIILSLAIFFGALTVLSQLAWNGIQSGVQARLKTQAIIRCEAKLAEVLAGAETLQPKSRVAFPDDPAWTYSVTISETAYPDLLQLDVTVSHSGNSRLATSEFTLRRWMRDPALFQEAALQQAAEETE